MDDKTKKVERVLDDAKQISTIGKTIVPGKAGGVIETVGKTIDEAKAGVGIWSRLSSLWNRKKK